MEEPKLTLLDLAIELLISVNKGSGGHLSGEQIVRIVEKELTWLHDQNMIVLPPEEVDEI